MTQTHAQTQPQREFDFNESDFTFIKQAVYDRTRIVLADHKKDMVYARLARRLRALGLKKFSDYCELISLPEGDQELQQFINAVTTNLTSFFREQHHFEHLGKHVIAPMSRAQQRIRLWSAGCSMGAEPYSIAMTAREAMASECDLKILATDIDTQMLTIGSTGEYNADQSEKIPEPYRKKYCERIREQPGHYRMGENVRSLITFKPLNLLHDWPFKGPFDAIFCRNVVIYFDKPTQKELFSRLADKLKPGGFLYIGHSENLFHVSDRFENTGRTIYRRLK